ncbi:MAG: dienelactone hydrolase family protein [Vicinamibacterales bacterium]|nr:dienelactone hydrolase family protein [Vicinamibacterales bacterium]
MSAKHLCCPLCPAICLLMLCCLVTGCVSPVPDVPSEATSPAERPIVTPPSESGAAAALEASPRQGEWVQVELPGSAEPMMAWVVRPESEAGAAPAPVVLVVHEIFGLTDWVRAVADRLAEDGFVAVAPDLLSGLGPDGGGTASVPSRDGAVRLIRTLDPDDVVARLSAVRAFASTLGGTTGAVATLGFCWGGSASFAYALADPELDAAVVFYGSSPEATEDYQRVAAPVLGLYGGDDERVNATVAEAEREMAQYGKHFETAIFRGAGHGFMRAQEDRQGANRVASEQAWRRAVEFLRQHL